MITDIFIRTYEKDLEWLQYCLRSIVKNVTGYRDVVICIPEGQEILLSSLTMEKVYKWKPIHDNGYIDQQINKIMAYEFTDADYIVFVDSDIVFSRKTDLSEFFENGKPIILKTDYSLVGDAIKWKGPTENLIGKHIQYEYMRRLPLAYKASTLKALFDKYKDRIISVDHLSEFNLIGAYADIFENEKYHFIDTERSPIPENCAIQHWSWGGITSDIRDKLEEICK